MAMFTNTPIINPPNNKIAGASETATVKETLTGSNTTMAIQLYEYSGIATSGSLDRTSSGNGTGSDPASTGAVMTSAADELLLAAITVDGADNHGGQQRVQLTRTSSPGLRTGGRLGRSEEELVRQRHDVHAPEQHLA